MRLKAFTATTLAEAMQQVRESLGDNATIMLTEDKGAAVRVVVSYDPDAPRDEAPPQPVPPATPPSPARKKREWLIADPETTPSPPPAAAAGATIPGAPGPDATLGEIFDYHGLPEALLPRLGPLAAITPLAERLEGAFRFAGPVDASRTKPLLLAGPPGSGKTLAAAKLAARAVIAGTPVRLISTDAGSAGAIEQLTAFTKPLGIAVEAADGAVGLATLLTSKPATADTLIIIDSQGVNPFERSELARLGTQIVTVRAEPILVMAAGGDPREQAELAEAFTRLGCTHLLATRLDLTRRFGGLLAAANAGLAFTEMNASPILANGLEPLNADALARLMLGGRQSAAEVP